MKAAIVFYIFILFNVYISPLSAQWVQQGPPVTGTDGFANFYTGALVALSADGKTAVESSDLVNGTKGGFFVFRWNGTQWVQQSLVTTNWNYDERVGGWGAGGLAISADGNTIAISGAAYGLWNDLISVYFYNGIEWALQSQWEPLDRGEVDGAGQQISLSYDGNTLLFTGQIWVRADNAWTLQQVLYPSDGSPGYNACVGNNSPGFSCQSSGALSADGNTVVIGDLYSPDQSSNAWVFVRNGTSWTQQGPRLEGIGNAGYNNQVAASPVCISGDGNTLGIGYYSENYGEGVWIFSRVGNIWTEQDHSAITGVQGYPYYTFFMGQSLSLSYDGNSLITGSNRYDGFFSFKRTSGVWHQAGGLNRFNTTSIYELEQQQDDYPDPGPVMLDSSGTRLLMGQPSFKQNNGGAWFFSMIDTSWAQTGPELFGTGLSGGASQGNRVALSRDGSTMAIAAKDDNGSEGAVWVLGRTGTGWTQLGQKLSVPDSVWQPRYFGTSITLSADGSTLAVGAPLSNNQFNYNIYEATGNIYVYTRNGGIYTRQTDSITVGGNSLQFGTNVALSDDGNTLLGSTIEFGSYVFVRNGSSWTQQAFLNPDTAWQGIIALSGDGNTAVLGDQNYDNQKGAMYIFLRTGNNWTMQAGPLQPTGLFQQYYFPSSLSVSQNGNVISAGCVWAGEDTGQVYIFTRSGNTWSETSTVISNDTTLDAEHGGSVVISSTGDTLIDSHSSSDGYLTGPTISIYANSGGQWRLASIAQAPVYQNQYGNIAASGDMQWIAAGSNYNATVFRLSNLSDALPLITPPTCGQSANGKIVLQLSGGTAPFRFVWSNAAPDADSATGLSSGTYSVTVTDAGTDTMVRQYVLSSIDTALLVTYSTTYSCATAKGSINLHTTGGSTPYSFVWNTGPVQNGNVATSISPGYYTCAITDSLGCMYTDTAQLRAVAYWLDVTGTNGGCLNAATATATFYGGTLPYRYIWSTGDTLSVIGPVTAGAYDVTVSDSTGCSLTGSVSVIADCDDAIQGTVFFDRNNDCIQDGAEPGAQNLTMIAGNGNYTVYGNTDYNGNYQILVPDTGNFTVSIAHWQECSYPVCSGETYPVPVSLSGLSYTATNVNLPLVNPGIDLALQANYVDPYPGSSFNYTIYYGNLQDSILPTGSLTLVYDSKLILNNASLPSTVIDTTTHTITWNLSGIGALYPLGQSVIADFTVPSTVASQSILLMQSTILPITSDCNILNNTLLLPVYVAGSLDPNYKIAYPPNTINVADSVITYTIHFQNTGDATTHFIQVLDTLQPDIDPSSVVTLATSNLPYTFTITKGGILSWVFNPISLPDSTSDPVNSQGFITYQVKVNPNLPVGTAITNTAFIYFDYNTPVATNTTTNVVSNLTVINRLTDNNYLYLFPNPATDQLFIKTENIQPVSITVYDVNGRIIYTMPFKPEIDINALSSGVYFVEVKSVEGVARKMFVKM